MLFSSSLQRLQSRLHARRAPNESCELTSPDPLIREVPPRMLAGRKVILEYQSAGDVNRNIFLLNHSYAFHAFGALHDQSNLLGAMLQTGRDAHGSTYVSFLSFLLLIQRQALSAFQMVWSHQSYQARVLLRPAIQGALMMGKWVDDPTNADIWKARQTDPKRYRGIGRRCRTPPTFRTYFVGRIG